MRSAARRWCLEVAGQRVHGTTRKQPLVVFRDEERHALGEWDAEPYEMTDWRTSPRCIPTSDSHSLPVRSLLGALCDMPARAESGGAARQQAGAHLPPGKTDQGPDPRQDRGGRSTDPDDYPAESERLPPSERRGRSSAARRHRDRPWQPMPSVSSTARCPGPSSGRDTSSYAWENATPLSATRCRMPEGSLRRPDRRAPSRAHTRRGPRAGGHAAGASTDAPRSIRQAGRRLRSCQRPHRSISTRRSS